MFYKKILLGLTLGLLLAQKVGATAVVLGTMKNAYLNDRIELRAPTYYVDGKSANAIALVDESQQFELKVEVPEPQIVFLIHNEDRLPVFVEPNDTLFIETDMFQFPLVVSFSGRAAHNNRLFRQFLQENPQDFNEFNNLRYKIGNWWTTVETTMDRYMDDLGIEDFRALMDKRKTAAFALLDDYTSKNPGKVSSVFQNYLSAEILYDWAYHLLFYGNVYKNKHRVEPAFFEFLYDAPTSNDMVGSEAYRRFLMTLMNWKQFQTGKTDATFADQYLMASDFLSEKALAFFQSEIIMLALKAEKYGEILPFYTSFLKNNKHHAFETKITDLYEKAVRFSPGVVAPNFSATDLYGNNVSMEQLRGKVVYLNFWASWCASCIKKMNFFDEYAAELNQEGVVLLNVSLDENPQNWNNAIGEEQLRGIHVKADAPVTGGGKNIAQLYNVEAVPQYFIIGKGGAFAEKGYSNQPDDIRKRLLELTKFH